MTKSFLALAVAESVAIPTKAATTSWEIDPNHANAQFLVKHLGISTVQGEFEKVMGTVNLDDQDLSKSRVRAVIDINSLNTRVSMRDNDLKSEHFFNATKYPTMTFQSTKIEKTGDGTAKMTGNLTIHGVTREVTFSVTGPTSPIKAMGGVRRGAEATATINRQDFGVSADLGMIGDQVQIRLDIEMVEK